MTKTTGQLVSSVKVVQRATCLFIPLLISKHPDFSGVLSVFNKPNKSVKILPIFKVLRVVF